MSRTRCGATADADTSFLRLDHAGGAVERRVPEPGLPCLRACGHQPCHGQGVGAAPRGPGQYVLRVHDHVGAAGTLGRPQRQSLWRAQDPDARERVDHCRLVADGHGGHERAWRHAVLRPVGGHRCRDGFGHGVAGRSRTLVREAPIAGTLGAIFRRRHRRLRGGALAQQTDRTHRHLAGGMVAARGALSRGCRHRTGFRTRAARGHGSSGGWVRAAACRGSTGAGYPPAVRDAPGMDIPGRVSASLVLVASGFADRRQAAATLCSWRMAWRTCRISAILPASGPGLSAS